MKILTKVVLPALLTICAYYNGTCQAVEFEDRLTLITLSVEDMQVSADFYENVLGWDRADISDPGIYFYRLNGITLALTPRNQLAEDAGISPKSSGFQRFSIAYYTRSIAEVDQLMSDLKEKGVSIVLPAGKTTWGGYRGYFHDPDGFLLEVIYNPLDPGWDIDCEQ